ncbi:hypothetical protein [Paraburkholderia sp. HP33-1]|uniref:hypothetical protein n=1 Tax=Paraburkholderia sp. HP33-1 TaxID=2883243 RepID=UPI001F32A4F9|nr:hypothetical protein [Paraburkholderia sp. HP33-1]
MNRATSKSKNSHRAWHLSLFICARRHVAGGRFALSAGIPAVQQKIGVKAAEQVFNDTSAVAFDNHEPARIHPK